MENTSNEGRIDYVEFSSTEIPRTQAFYNAVFGWQFKDWGPDYTDFSDGRIAGGFAHQPPRAPLVVIYTADLAGMEAKVRAAGGVISRETFSFPGGRRFHFTDPDGNELSIWSDK